ncbi:hypothetical protein BAE44_0011039 [Dichanthelium oligosanthes]|uniref:Uncharacterized protein n=1 Tax=Dichanthelium oligosanthes TaxID=888268 RepID=A0A1E5VS46_9POAL|nr:hypothetical protein BAE44_0011039 [Dichanthelium oligosanthes]
MCFRTLYKINTTLHFTQPKRLSSNLQFCSILMPNQFALWHLSILNQSWLLSFY